MFFWGKIADSIERNAFFYENHVFFFFFLGKLSSARDSASSVLIFLQIHSPPCSDFDPHGSESARSAFFFFGGGAGVRKQNDKTREPPGPGPGPGPGWQATVQNRQTSRPTRCRIHKFVSQMGGCAVSQYSLLIGQAVCLSARNMATYLSPSVLCSRWAWHIEAPVLYSGEMFKPNW